MRFGITFMAGLIFGFGLLLSGMTSPDRVLGFLDIAGNWDPSLAFVMGGAVITATPLFLLARRRQRPIAGIAFDQPDTAVIDRKLVGGAVLFGIGWGIAGICPGPALVDMALDPVATAPFVVAMIAGILAASRWRAGAARRKEA